jgi:periplasmic protein TonB
MSYTDNKQMTTGQMWSLGITILITALLAWAMVNGGYQVVKKKVQDLNTFDVKDEPPPPEELPPPPPPDQNIPPPPVVSPPPIVQTNQAPPPVTTVATPPPVFVPSPEPPRPAPPPPPIVTSKMTPKGNPGSWATDDDYPPAAQRNEEQGTTGFALEVGPDGRVTSCRVTASSGSASLDEATCRLVSKRARFTPGKDAAGNALGGSYSNRIRWKLPE